MLHRACSPRTQSWLTLMLATGLAALPLPAGAYKAYVSTDAMTSGGFQHVEVCQGSTAGQPGLQYHGPWYCAGGADGSGGTAEHGSANVWARAALDEASLRMTATADGAATLSIGDLLWIAVPGLEPGQSATLSFEFQVDGGFGRAPASGIGQAGFWFQAYSGVFSPVLSDQVGFAVAWRTAWGSDSWNTTAAPEVFEVTSSIGDWTVLATDRFRAEIDLDGSDPTLGFVMGLFASGPADFGHTATIRFTPGPRPVFTSESGVLLSAVPEPGAAVLLLAGLAALGARRLRPG